MIYTNILNNYNSFNYCVDWFYDNLMLIYLQTLSYNCLHYKYEEGNAYETFSHDKFFLF